MMKLTKENLFSRLYLLSCICLTSVMLAGCAEEVRVGGGALVEPDVTFLPADVSGGGDVAEAAGSTEQAVASTESGPGTIKGQVKLSGGGSALPPLFVKGAEIKDKEVCAAGDVPDERLVLGAENGVSNVFIYMKKAPKGTPKMEAPAEPLFFDQKACQFIPHCMIVPVGATLKVLSGDPIAHNTHTNPAKNNGVSSVVPENDRVGVLELKYTRSEDPFSVTCDFHAWMKAYHLPLDHPFGAVTDENGNFEIKDVPSGNHDFVVWHESATGGYIERKLKVTVTAGEVTDVNIDYPAAKLNL